MIGTVLLACAVVALCGVSCAALLSAGRMRRRLSTSMAAIVLAAGFGLVVYAFARSATRSDNGWVVAATVASLVAAAPSLVVARHETSAASSSAALIVVSAILGLGALGMVWIAYFVLGVNQT